MNHPSFGLNLGHLDAVVPHIYSTLFTAQDVMEYLTDEEGIASAVRWCADTSIKKVYLESYRGHLTANSSVLVRAKSGEYTSISTIALIFRGDF